MKFLANENFPKASIDLLRKDKIDIKSITEYSPGISDYQVIEIASKEGRTILTHDNDYGELIFKFGYKPPSGVIPLKLSIFQPEDPAKILFTLLTENVVFGYRLTVINEKTIRQRIYK